MNNATLLEMIARADSPRAEGSKVIVIVIVMDAVSVNESLDS